jgi:hypothetical protein
LTYPAIVSFGAASGGLNTVGYQLKTAAGTNVGGRVTSGVTELAAGSGIYRTTLTLTWHEASLILWDTGQGGATKYAAEAIRPPGLVWEALEAEHMTPNTFGIRAQSLQQDMIRAWVWNAPLANHAGETTFGGSLQLETGYGGIVAATTPTTVQLGANEGTTVDFGGWGVSIHSGQGSGQYRTIVGYAPTTRTATLDRAWTVTPNNTSIYKLWPPVSLDVGGTDTLPIEAGVNLRQTVRAIAAVTAGTETQPTATGVAYAALGSPGTPRVASTVNLTTGVREATSHSLGS